MCEQAPPTPEETRPSERQARKKDSKQGIQDIPLLFVNNNRMLCPISGHIYRSGENINHLGSDQPSFPQCLMGLEVWPTTEPLEPESSMDGEPKRVHQFQKNNLLPCFEGSSLPSMVGLGSGWGLEWYGFSGMGLEVDTLVTCDTKGTSLTVGTCRGSARGSREGLGPGGGTIGLTAF